MHKAYWLALWLVLGATAACEKDVPFYCDENAPCTSSTRPFCDLRGEYPASDHVARTCIPNPVDAGVDMGVDAGLRCRDSQECRAAAAPICEVATGQCLGCKTGDECLARDAARPLCDDGTCVECMASATDCQAVSAPICGPDATCRACLGHEECAAKDTDRPLCRGADKTCVECEASADCKSSVRPVCEGSTGSCRPCRGDSECASEVCDEATGACTLPESIVYVGGANASSAADCGSQAGPCQTITQGLGKVNEARKVVRIREGTYGEFLKIDGLKVTLVGVGAAVVPTLHPGKAAVEVLGAADVTLEGISLESARTGSSADGLRCAGSQGGAIPKVVLKNTTISSNEGDGIDASYCVLSIHKTHVSQSGGVGVSASGSSVTLEQSQVTGSGGVGVSASGSSTLTLRRTMIAQNLGGGLLSLDSSFDVVNNFFVENGKVAPGATQPGGVTLTTPGAMSVFRFNTVAANSAGAAVQGKGIQCLADAPISLSSNIVYDNPGGDQFFGVNCTLAYSDVEQALGGTNLHEDPHFVDAPASNYHLKTSSPCRDQGDPAGGTHIDYDGDSRAAAPYDMGADELP